MTNPDSREKEILLEGVFAAAENDDVSVLEVLAKFKVNLNRQDKDCLEMTPMHVASIHSSNRFIRYACENLSFDLWIRDRNLRTAFDHAVANGNKEAQTLLHRSMFSGVDYSYS